MVLHVFGRKVAVDTPDCGNDISRVVTLIAVEEYAGVRVLPGKSDEVVVVRQHDEIAFAARFEMAGILSASIIRSCVSIFSTWSQYRWFRGLKRATCDSMAVKSHARPYQSPPKRPQPRTRVHGVPARTNA